MTSAAATSRPQAKPALILDVIERLTLFILFTRLILNTYQAVLSTGHWYNWLLVTSEGLGLFFVFIRKPATEVSDRASDWVVAFVATAAPLTVHPAGFSPLAPVGVGVSLLLLGLGGQIAAKLTLRRSFGIVPANRGVKIGGPYRYVRHPMYLGYLGVHAGFLLMTPSLWNLGVYAVSTAFQLVRILAEERLLRQDAHYVDFCAATPYRLLPGLF